MRLHMLVWPFKFTHLIIIKSEVSPFPIVVIVVCLRWLYHHMLSVSYISRESWIVSLSLCNLMVCANNRVHRVNGTIFVFVSLHIALPHYHHYAGMWKYWTFKMLVMYILSSVCLVLNLFSQSTLLWWSLEYVNLILLSPSSNRKYEPFAIA